MEFDTQISRMQEPCHRSRVIFNLRESARMAHLHARREAAWSADSQRLTRRPPSDLGAGAGSTSYTRPPFFQTY